MCLFQNGFLNSLPYLCAVVFTMGGAYTADAMIKRKLFSIGVVRKIVECIGKCYLIVFLY